MGGSAALSVAPVDLAGVTADLVAAVVLPTAVAAPAGKD